MSVDRDGKALVVGAFVSEVGISGLGCVMAVDLAVESPVEPLFPTPRSSFVLVSWLSSPGELMVFDSYDLALVDAEPL